MPIEIPGWPVVTDDSGTLTDGTLFNESYNQDVHDAVQDLTYGVANPDDSAASVIDEVIAARGSMDTLDERLDVALNEDGTLRGTEVVTETRARSAVRAMNHFANADLQHWSGGSAAAPDEFYGLGAGIGIARCGPSESDTTSFQAGRFVVKVTRAGADVSLGQDIIPTTDFGTEFKRLATAQIEISASVICQADLPNQCRLVISDGPTTTASAYHTGGGTPEVLTVTHTMTATTSTFLNCRVQVLAADGSGYFGGFVLVVGSIPPAVWMPYTSWDARHLKTPRLYAASMTTGNVGAGEDDLGSYSLAPNLWAINGQTIRVTAYFTFANTGANKKIKFYLGTDNITLFDAVITNVKGKAVVELTRVSNTSQRVGAVSLYSAGAVLVTIPATFTRTLTTSLALKFTGEATADNDIVQNQMIVELI